MAKGQIYTEACNDLAWVCNCAEIKKVCATKTCQAQQYKMVQAQTSDMICWSQEGMLCAAWQLTAEACFSLSLINSCSVDGSRPNRFHSLYSLYLCFFNSPLCSWILLGLTLTVVMEIYICSVVTQWQLSFVIHITYWRDNGICCSLDCQWKSVLQEEMKTMAFVHNSTTTKCW